MRALEALLTPAEYAGLPKQDLSNTVCVVFDVLRATSAMITALRQGADSIVPVSEIPEALEWKRREPAVLLAGERHGLRIRAEQTGSIDFDLGNSPREFVAARVTGRRIVTTTTNGTRALKACQGAQRVLVGALLNIEAVAIELRRLNPERVLLVCSGTGEDAAFEDTVAVGAVVDRLSDAWPLECIGDAAHCARHSFLASKPDLLGALQTWARNGRRLEGIPDLAGDLPVCAAMDSVPLLAVMDREGMIRRCS